jgi:hypothetical protein
MPRAMLSDPFGVKKKRFGAERYAGAPINSFSFDNPTRVQ